MSPEEIHDGLAVAIATDRLVFGHSMRGRIGTVAYTFERDRIDDWVFVALPDDAVIFVAFSPDELDPS